MTRELLPACAGCSAVLRPYLGCANVLGHLRSPGGPGGEPRPCRDHQVGYCRLLMRDATLDEAVAALVRFDGAEPPGVYIPERYHRDEDIADRWADEQISLGVASHA